MAMKGFCALGLARCMASANQFLAGAGGAGDQYAGILGGDHARFGEHGFHPGIAGNDGVRPVEFGGGSAALFQCPFYLGQQGFGLERLGEIAEYPPPHRIHRMGDRTVGGENDDRQGRVSLLQGVEQGQPVHAAHLDIGNHQIRPAGSHFRQGLLAAAGLDDGKAFEVKAHGQEFEQRRVVIHDQDFRPLSHGCDSAGPTRRLRIVCSSSAC
jgi:hypothetical protein